MHKGKLYAKVAVNAPIFETLTYQIPLEFAETIEKGWRVVVPLGNRRVAGFVVEIIDEPDIDKTNIKKIEDLPDSEAVLTPSLFELCKFVSEYYVAPLGMVFASAISAPIGLETDVIVEPTGNIPSDEISPIQSKILSLVSEQPITVKELGLKIGRKAVLYHIRLLEKMELVKRVWRTRHQTPPRYTSIAMLSPDIEPAGWADDIQKSAPKQAEVIRFLGIQKIAPATLLRKMFGANVLDSLVKKGIVILQKQELFRQQEGWISASQDIKTLTKSQSEAIAEIQKIFASLLAPNPNTQQLVPILLYGVTASGKTLVYLEAGKMARQMEKGVLVLVPEVALTPQMWGALRDYFGEDVAVLHSYLSSGERADAWRKLRRGEIKIALGARSAIFAPVQDLGLIVVDEEQDQSYKQQNMPFYNARDLAVMRGKIENALVILGSATPSVESFYNATIGKYRLIEMPERIPDATLPKIELVDTKKLPPQFRLFAPTTLERLKSTTEKGEQAILLLNRRGFSDFIICPSCGYIPKCPQCELSLTYHRIGDMLKCHWCGHQQPAPENCPNCNTSEFKYRGKGTQKIEVELFRIIQPEKVVRIDSDAIEAKGALKTLLERFSSLQGSVLVGTQMVAKGHHFPKVTLVIVVDADIGLAMPDFRAGERTFQILAQVAGRAGRGSDAGTVIIQTKHPDAPPIQFAINNDFKSFFTNTLAQRQILRYPPFTHLVRILATSPNSADAEAFLRTIYRELIIKNVNRATILPPTRAPLGKIKGEYRWHLLVKTERIMPFLPYFRELVQRKTKSVKVRVDVDPYDVM